MARLAVIGNISRDVLVSQHPADSAPTPSGQLAPPRPGTMTVLGGAGLHVARAATAAGLAGAPVAVLGDDLVHLRDDPRFAALDWSGTRVEQGASASFTLSYHTDGELADVVADYGVAVGLTEHALARIQTRQDDSYHVCCRHPLDVAATTRQLIDQSARFSLDFIVSSAAATSAAAAEALPHAAAVFLNATELPYLDAITARENVAALVISDGPRPVRLYRHGTLAATLTPPTTSRVVAYAGAGDTLTGTFLAARALGLPDQQALTEATAAASAHIATPAPTLHAREKSER